MKAARAGGGQSTGVGSRQRLACQSSAGKQGRSSVEAGRTYLRRPAAAACAAAPCRPGCRAPAARPRRSLRWPLGSALQLPSAVLTQKVMWLLTEAHQESSRGTQPSKQLCDSTEDASQPQAALGHGLTPDIERPCAAPRAITAPWQARCRHAAGVLPCRPTSPASGSAQGALMGASKS